MIILNPGIARILLYAENGSRNEVSRIASDDYTLVICDINVNNRVDGVFHTRNLSICEPSIDDLAIVVLSP